MNNEKVGVFYEEIKGDDYKICNFCIDAALDDEEKKYCIKGDILRSEAKKNGYRCAVCNYPLCDEDMAKEEGIEKL